MTDRPIWWTAADAAELDVVVHELVEVVWGQPDSADARAAIQSAVDWRNSRVLLSRAEGLRREQILADIDLEAAAA